MPVKNKIYQLQNSVTDIQIQYFSNCLFSFDHNNLAQRKDNKMLFNSSNKSNTILFLQIVFLIVFIYQKGYSQERVWTFVGTDEKETTLTYVDTNTQRQSNGNLFVWQKLIRIDTNFVIGLVEWDCQEKRSRTIQQTLYDRYGEPLNMSKSSDWIYVIDGTLGASIYRMVCQASKNTRKYSASKINAKVSLAEIISLKASLRELPNIKSNVIREISKGERLILVDEAPQGNWYRVIDKDTQSEGWLHKTTFRIIEPSKTPQRKTRKKTSKQFD